MTNLTSSIQVSEEVIETIMSNGSWIGSYATARALAKKLLAMKAAEPLPQGDELRLHVAKALSIPQHHTTWDLLTEAEQDLFLMQADYALKAMGGA